MIRDTVVEVWNEFAERLEPFCSRVVEHMRETIYHRLAERYTKDFRFIHPADFSLADSWLKHYVREESKRLGLPETCIL